MATKEPYVSSSVYDMTGGLQPAPADDGYNIAMWVNTPAGPTTKTKVLSQKDFIDKYMIGTSITPNDHMSAIMAYMTLAQNPLYVLRACPVSFLEGISCTGNSYLFDKNYHVLDSYNRFKIEDIAVPSGNHTVAKEGSSSSISDTTNSALIAKIMSDYEQAEPAAVAMKPISAENYSIVARQKLSFSNNVAVKAEQIQYGEYSCATATELETLNEGTSLNVGDTTYYFFGTGVQTGSHVNGKAINYANGSKTSIDAQLFLHLVAQASGVIENPSGAFLQLIKEGINLDFKQNSTDINLSIINYGNLPSLPSKVTTSFDDATYFANSTSIKITNSTPVVTETVTETEAETTYYSVAQDSIWVDSGSLKYYKKTASTTETISPAYTVPAAQVCTVQYVNNESTIVESYMFIAPVSVNGVTVEQLFCLPITDNDGDKTCVQIQDVCKDHNDLLNFMINKWAGLKADYNLAVMGELGLWSKAVTPFAVASQVTAITTDVDGDSVPTYHYIIASNEENANVLEHDFLWIQVNDVLYYSGTFTPGFVITANTQVQLTPNKCNSNEFRKLLENALYLNQKIGSYKGYCVSTSKMVVRFDDTMMSIDGIGADNKAETIVQTGRTEQFAIVQAFPTTEAMFQYSYELDKDSVDSSGSIYNLHLNYKGGEVRENWTISFNPGKVDGYGVDQWYNRVQSDYFKIVSFTEEGVLGDIQDSFSSQTWGRGVSVPEHNIQYAINAMQSLPQYEDGVWYHVLSDAGVANTNLAKAIEALAIQMSSVYLPSLPEAELNVESLIAFVGAADIKNFQSRMLAAGDRININGFSKILPGSYKLILQYINMFRNKGAEFAPNFGLSHGVVGVSNLVQAFSKPERERLLDYKIETLKGGVVTEYYINKNVTAQKATTYMSEEQNVRMTNIAVHLCEDNLKQYIGELNTAVLRDLVQTRLTAAIQDRLFKGKQYVPAMYMVVCDKSNNPDPVIEQNKLVVSLYASFTPSIQYVLVDHFIVPLSQVQ